MAKKPAFPTKTCPSCGKLIHARSLKHLECGWVGAAKSASKAKNGRRKKAVHVGSNGSAISIQDIQAVKAVVAQLGAEKVQQLAKVLAQ
jgi:hypothetical protein